MSGLTGGLVPLGGSSRTSSKATAYDDDEFGGDADDFDTLFNDMLDKPTPKSKGGKKSSKSSSNSGGGGGKKKKFDVEASLESFGSPSSNYSTENPAFSGSSRPHANSPDDSDDGNAGVGGYGGSSENLEDSILGKLGGIKSGGTTNDKKASKPDTVASTAARTSGFVHNARSIESTTGLGRGGTTTSTTSSMQYSDHNDGDGDRDHDDMNEFDMEDIELPDMGGYQPSVTSSYSTVSARPPSSSLPSSSAAATTKGNTTSWSSSGETTTNNYNSYDSTAGGSTKEEPSSSSGGGSGGGGGDGDLGGFIPSFYEPGRQTRQRRILGTTSTSASMGSLSQGGVRNSGHLDELDAMLGLGATAGNSVRGKVSDPFGSTRYSLAHTHPQYSPSTTYLNIYPEYPPTNIHITDPHLTPT